MKDQNLKQYCISQRKSTKQGISGAPVWVMQKAGKRIWNKKQRRHWRRCSLRHDYDRIIGKY